MKLTYKLLWFDDEPEMVHASERSLKRQMRAKGFNLEIENRTDISDQAIEKLGGDLAKYNPYDIIVFDHDLGKCHGTDIAKSLRMKVFTDMVYYSAASIDVLRKAIYEANVDGVFLINKQSCVDDLMRILEDHIKKNCDLNSMRGIVLDAISEMEVMLRKYLTTKLQNDKNDLRAQRLKRLQANFHSREKKWKTDADNMTEDLMLSYFKDPLKTDFNTIRQTLYSCEKDWEYLKDNGLLDELQKLRNVFAHESYKWEQEKNCVIVCSNGKETRFGTQEFESIRKNLLLMLDEIQDHCKISQ